MYLARKTLALAVTLAFTAAVCAQEINLTEEAKPGDCSKYHLELAVVGQMILNQEGQKETLKIEARARHRFEERTLTTEGGLPKKTLRHYDEALARATAGPNAIERSLPADRRHVVVDRRPEGVLSYCPAGPLTREELDTVAEHFHPHSLPGLLPGKPVMVGETWKVDAATVQAACLFDALGKFDLTGKLVGVENGRAAISLEGTAEGIETGASVKLTISATGTFDLNQKRITEITWKQKDERSEGPINPASTVDATIVLKREVLAAAPADLNEVAIATIPQVPNTSLRYADPKGEFQFVYPREWHITGQTDSHLILRLLDRGELIAQATLTRWRKSEPGKHATAEEFKKTVDEIPGWVAKQILEDGVVPADGGRWLYRISAVGEVNGLPVVQGFHLLAGPQGHHLVLAFAMKPEKVKAVGPRDIGLVMAVEFAAAK